uniref:Uncharacterized protein n=1 Tax=Daucus carota subsp. sativus TaxID=79200 RepID=A0A162AI08_DAUCS
MAPPGAHHTSVVTYSFQLHLVATEVANEVATEVAKVATAVATSFATFATYSFQLN